MERTESLLAEKTKVVRIVSLTEGANIDEAEPPSVEVETKWSKVTVGRNWLAGIFDVGGTNAAVLVPVIESPPEQAVIRAVKESRAAVRIMFVI